MSSNVERALKYYRDKGWRCGIVERYIAQRRINIDLFGIIDLICIHPHHGVCGVQVCGTDFAPHVRKILVDRREDTQAWLMTPGASLELIGWRKVKVKRGGKALVWAPRIRTFSMEDLDDD